MRFPALSPLCLSFAALLAGTASSLPPAPPGSATSPAVAARLDLEVGRGLLVDRTGVIPLRRSAGPYVISGQGHLELAPGSRALLRWPGQASLELRGPASFAWRGEDGPSFFWSFTSLHEAELEIRTREARIDLPDAWRLRLQRGAYSLYALAGGGCHLEHRAGRPAQATWLGGEGLSPPPVAVGPGQSARLAGTPRVESAVDRTATARRWDASSWPWGDGAIPDLPGLITGRQPPWTTDRWPWGPPPAEVEPWKRWDWPWWGEEEPREAEPPETESREAETVEVPVEAGPDEAPPGEPSTPIEFVDPGRVAPHPAAPSPRRAALEPSRVAPDPEPPAPAPAEEAPVANDPAARPTEEPAAESAEPVPHDPDLWRGLPADQLEEHRHFRLQKSPDWTIEELPSGRQRIRLDRVTLEPAWFLGREVDYRLFPGAELVLERDGSVRFHTGWIRILDATPGRRL